MSHSTLCRSRLHDQDVRPLSTLRRVRIQLEPYTTTLYNEIIILFSDSNSFFSNIDPRFDRHDHPWSERQIRIADIMCINPEKMSDRMREIGIRNCIVFFNIWKFKSFTDTIHIFLHCNIPLFSSDTWFENRFSEVFHLHDGIMDFLLSRSEYSRDRECSRNISTISIELDPEVDQDKIALTYLSIKSRIVKCTPIQSTRNNRRKCLNSSIETELIRDHRFDLIFIHSWANMFDQILIDLIRDLDTMLHFLPIFD